MCNVSQHCSTNHRLDAFRPHEDYPDRVPDTCQAILDTVSALRDNPRVTLSLIRGVHRQVFPDHGAAGQWRTLDVRAADYLARGGRSSTGSWRSWNRTTWTPTSPSPT